MPKTDILILSASYGDGHQQAARALAASLRSLEPNVQVEILDFFRFVNPIFNAFTRCSYIQTVRKAPRLYGAFYHLTGNIRPDSFFQKRLNRLGTEKLLNFLNERQPRLVVCTYPTPAGVLSELRAAGKIHFPIATVITDNAVHSQWIHPQVDLYLVPCEEVRQGLGDRGLPLQRVAVTGIPINPKFTREHSRAALREQWGLQEDLPMVLVMSGAYGMLGGTYDICRLLADFPSPLQTVVVCGHDRRLRHRLLPLTQQATRPLHAFGFLKTIDELMSVADLLITKAGGLTTAEALAKDLPMLIYRPIPGQEEENTKYLSHIGAATAAHNRRELLEKIGALLEHPEQLAQMRDAASRHGHPAAAIESSKLLLDLLHRERPATEPDISTAPGTPEPAR